MTDLTERRQAKLLSLLLLALVVSGFTASTIALALDPSYLTAYWSMQVALLLLGGAYVASRTPHFRKAVWVGIVVPIVSCAVLRIVDRADTTSGAFMMVAVLFASIFSTPRQTAAVAACAFLAFIGASLLRSHTLGRGDISLMFFHALFSPLIVIATVHRNALERIRREEARRRDAELHATRQLETLGRVVGGIAHDFNNLLLVIGANAELLSRQDVPGSEDLTKDIGFAVERGTGLTRQLLATARRQLTHPEPLSLGSLMAEITPLLRRLIGAHIALHVECEPDAEIMGDRSQIEQVLMNLALNARDAMPRGGVLTIETRQRAPRSRPAPTPAWVCLSVSDTGEGMDAETQAHIFEPFFSTKGARGYGLGLPTVLRIVEQGRGCVEVASVPGQGTRFDVYLPRAPRSVQAPAAERTSAINELRARASAAILLVEDDLGVRRAVVHMLTELGHRVREAQSGGEALEVFERDGGHFDLLLVDILIPVMNGIEVAQRLRAREPSVRVLFMTGCADSSADAARTMPAASIIGKPFSREELGAKIEHCLGRGAAPAAPAGTPRPALASGS